MKRSLKDTQTKRPKQLLVDQCPEVLTYWADDANVYEVTSGSNRKCRLRCKNTCGNECKHEWTQRANYIGEAFKTMRINGRTSICPYCNRSPYGVCCFKKSLWYRHPELRDEWAPENGDMKTVKSGTSHKKYKWICKNTCNENCQHVWHATPDTRIRYKTECPYCCSTNRKVCCEEKSIFKTHPHLVSKWDHELNPDIRTVAIGSHKKVHWICSKSKCGCIHRFQATPYQMNKDRDVCKYCSNHVLCCSEGSVAKRYPDLVAIWADSVPIESIPYGTDNKYRFKCMNAIECGCNHVYMARPRDVGRRGHACPYCAGKRICCVKASAAGKMPNLLNEWHPTNTVSLADVSPSSKIDILWRCVTCGHKWQSSCHNRIHLNSGCPSCTNGPLCAEQCCDRRRLAIQRPDLYDELAEDEMDIYLLSWKTSKNVKWKCQTCDHKWNATIGNRTGNIGSGCPKCAPRSKAEVAMEDVLKSDTDIQKHVSEHPVKGGTKHGRLRYDFHVTLKDGRSLVIEMDGEAHFMPVQFGGISQKRAQKNFERQCKNDAYKEQVCPPMLRISYDIGKDEYKELWNYFKQETLLKPTIKVIRVGRAYH